MPNTPVPVEGSKVRMIPNDRNAEKGIVGVEGEVTRKQDFILHVKANDTRLFVQRVDVEVLS